MDAPKQWRGRISKVSLQFLFSSLQPLGPGSSLNKSRLAPEKAIKAPNCSIGAVFRRF